MPRTVKQPYDIGRDKVRRERNISTSNEKKLKKNSRYNGEQQQYYKVNHQNEGHFHSDGITRNGGQRRKVKVENSSSWKLYQMTKNSQEERYDGDVSSSFTSVFSYTYDNKSQMDLVSDHMGQMNLDKYSHVHKYERINRQPVVPVPCRNVSYSAMKLRQQTQKNLKLKYFSDINKEQRAKKPKYDDDTNKMHRQRRRDRRERRKQQERMCSTTVGIQTDVPSTVTKMVHPSTKYPIQFLGDRCLTLEPNSARLSKMLNEMLSISFLLWTLLGTFLNRIKTLLCPVPPYIEIFFWIFVMIVLIYFEINFNFDEYFEMFYQYLANLL